MSLSKRKIKKAIPLPQNSPHCISRQYALEPYPKLNNLAGRQTGKTPVGQFVLAVDWRRSPTTSG